VTEARACVRLTQGAENDLRGIWRRRAAQRGAAGDDGADALIAALVDRMEGLAIHPSRGPVPPELELLGIRRWRQVSHPPYRIIYGFDDTKAEPVVTVAIIADSRRDFRSLLAERLLNAPNR
jgi:toxin ParE1/3/4